MDASLRHLQGARFDSAPICAATSTRSIAARPSTPRSRGEHLQAHRRVKPEPHQGGPTTGLTRTGGILGSPLYMSPEQARGLSDIDYHTDLWSLGMVLYPALSGRVPHEHIEAFGDLIMAICSLSPEPIQELAPWGAGIASGSSRARTSCGGR